MTLPEPIAELVDSTVVAPVADPAPSPETPPADPVADPAPVDPAKIEPILYETPDGRKVDAETLQKEWKENFLPEFTRKSQLLAEIDRKKELNNPPKDEPAWKSPDYVPQNYAEVIELAKAEAVATMKSEVQAEEDRVAAIQTEVDTQLTDLRKADPKLDENALFLHANKYGFRDLKVAYANMADMKKAVVNTEQRVVKDLKTREADPIAGAPGGDLPDASGYDPTEMSQFDSATAYLQHLKGKK